jgi:hypothetical protein
MPPRSVRSVEMLQTSRHGRGYMPHRNNGCPRRPQCAVIRRQVASTRSLMRARNRSGFPATEVPRKPRV